MQIVNASALPRIQHCGGSVRLVDALKTSPPDNEYKREGIAAHFAAECAVKRQPIPSHAPNGVEIDDDMRDAAADYAKRIPPGVPMGDMKNCAWIEQECNWLATETIQINAKTDAAWIAEKVLYVPDFKYGWRIVEPFGNWQLIAYAVGLLRMAARVGQVFDLTHVVLAIFQPRPYHPNGPWREWRLTIDELIEYHNRIVIHLERLGAADLHTGGHCRQCPGGETLECPAYHSAFFNAVDVAMSGGPMDLPEDAIASELRTIERAAEIIEQRKDWLTDIAKRRIQSGKIVPGFVLEPQYGNRVWLDFEKTQAGTNIDLTVKKPCTPKEAERRGVAEETLAAATKRPLIGQKLKPAKPPK